MAVKRKYLPIGSEPVYDYYFDLYSVNSYILNAGSKQTSFDSIVWDKHNAQVEYLRIIGDENGMYYREGEEQLAAIPICEKTIKALESKFKDYQAQKIRMGYERPTNWPKELKDEKLKAEACLDVLRKEAEVVQSQLEKYKAVVEEIRTKDILTQGPKGSGKLRNDLLSEIDGQRVVQSPLGTPFINEPSSPFHGMSVADYRKYIVTPWIKECERKANENLERARLEGKITSSLTSGQIRGTTGTPWPEWPEGSRNYITEPEIKDKEPKQK